MVGITIKKPLRGYSMVDESYKSYKSYEEGCKGGSRRDAQLGLHGDSFPMAAPATRGLP